MTRFYQSTSTQKSHFSLFLAFLYLLALPTLAQTIRYVKPTATGTGTGASWLNASGDLQAMITASAANDQVWVAAGTYKPGGSSPTTGSTFSMQAGVAIYGNFAGTETALSQRTLTTPLNTILSGDIGTPGVQGDNCNRVITNDGNGLTSTAILDGFIISDASGGAAFGGGMYNRNSSPTIRNCLFQNNAVGSAGALGGGMMTWGDGSGNTASPALKNCSFLNNGGNFGAGIYINATNFGTSSPVLTNCSFQGNTAGSLNSGSAIAVATNQGTANPQATNCIILGTIVTSFNGAAPTLATTNCLLLPGSIYGVAGNVTQTNNITTSVSPFVNTTSTQILNCSDVINAGLNTAPGLSGITTDAGGNPRIFPVSGGTVDIGAYEYVATTPIRPSTVTAQPASVSSVCAGSTVAVNVQVTGSGVTYQWYKTSTAGVTTLVSGAVNASLTLTSVQKADEGAYQVVAGCNSVTSTAFNLLVDAPIFVTPAGAGAQNGVNWANAYPGTSLQTAINAAQTSCGKQVWVATGTYKPTTTNARAISFSMKPGVAIYGGFVGTEALLSQRPAISLTVPPSSTLSGDVANAGNNNNSSYNIIANGPGLTATAIIDGFVFTLALGNNSVFPQNAGGAINNNGTGSGNVCSPTIRNCWFTNNQALGGGAIYNGGANSGNSNPTISNCRFENNQKAFGTTTGPFAGNNGGGGIMNDAATSGTSNPVISNCLFKNNSSYIGGGIFNNAMFSGVASGTVINCVFQGNTTTLPSSGGGSAIYNAAFNSSTSNPTITNCSFLANTALLYGGAIVNASNGTGSSVSSPIITNCSFQSNTAPSGGGAVYNSVGTGGITAPKIINSVFFGNGNSTNGTFLNNDGGASITLTYSLFEPNTVTGTGVDGSGTGNLTTTVTPFLNTSGNDLGNCSPAVNAGLNSTPKLVGITTDILGNPRLNGTVDMGAYESVLNLIAGTIDGPPIVPFPQEAANTLTNLTAASAAATPTTLKWQQSSDNGSNWTDIPSSNALAIVMPTPLTTGGNANLLYQFRRVITDVCGRPANTPPVTVNVVKSDGRFLGQVVSGDGITPVAGVTVTAVRTTTGLSGSPTSWTYTTITGADGSYNIAPVYYGVPAGTSPTALTAASFTITPTYTDPNAATLVHVFSPANQTFTLNQFNNPKSFNFTDQTTFGINGQTRQVCPDCITGFSGQTPIVGSQTCPVDGAAVKTFRNGTQINFTQTGYQLLPNPGDYGRFAVAVNNPGSYSLTAEKTNLTFTPAGQTVAVSSNVYNVNFDSPTSQTIAGRVSAGCGEALGAVTLEFTDVLKDGNGASLPICFRKRVTTSATGFYSIVLPPRKYKVTVISLTPNGIAGVASPDLVAFINNQFPIDSLTRDLTSTTAVTGLNLTYQRPPTLVIRGLVSPPGCGTAAAYYLMQQGNPTSLTVTAYQGNTSCPVISGTALVSTNVQVDTGENFSGTVVSGSRSLSLVPGTPNIIAPFYRTLNAQFTDMFGRTATPLNLSIVVTGVQAGTATFQSTSPQIPLLVLHDPPGDGSFSFWSTSTTQENAIRFSYSLGTTTKTWYEAKVGVKLFTGIFVITENTAFATLGGGITATQRNVNARETVLTTTTGSYLSTNNTSAGVGSGADIFYGTALNMFYAVSTVIAFDPTSCTVGASQKLIVANSGRPGTDFYYTADYIRDAIIPNFIYLSSITTVAADKRKYEAQVKVWQQVLDNNEKNKREAAFVRNASFGGVLGDISGNTTTSVRKSNTIEYGIDIDNEVAIALGFEVAGNGFSGGVTVNFKAEIGGSETNTTTREVTTGYTLRDNTADLLSVDIKTDPIYGTPVFDLLGGSTSCPTEPGTLARDNFQLTAPVTVRQNIPANGSGLFTLNIGNISQVTSDASRPVYLKLVPESNPDGAQIKVNGSDYSGPILYSNVNRLGSISVTVEVIKSAASSVYAYEGLQFQLLDACSPGGGTPLKTVSLAAFFQSPCSSVSLTTPDQNWISTLADNNSLPVLISGYTLANLTNVTFQYRPTGGTYTDVFTLSQAQLNNSVNGTQVNWNTTGLADGTYDLRVKLTCPLGGGAVGVVNSARITGLFDRSAPLPLGNTQPANSTYVAGSTIGITYNENLACAQLSASNVVAKRVGNGQVIPVSVGCYQNQVVITPLSSLTPFTGELISLTLTGVSDIYNNARTTADSWAFQVGTSPVVSGTAALSITLSGSPLLENSTGTMLVTVQLPATTPNDMWVNFGVAGTASFGTDYTVSYLQPTTQPLSATVNGTRGQIMIPGGSSSAIMLVKPVNDSFYEPDETLIFSLLAGGDYQISATASVTGVIQNDDLPCAGAVTTVKDGAWNDPAVWSCGAVPITSDIVQVNHAVIVAQNYVALVKRVKYGTGGKLTYRSGAQLRMGF